MPVLLRIVRGKQHILLVRLDEVIMVLEPELCSVHKRLALLRDDIAEDQRGVVVLLDVRAVGLGGHPGEGGALGRETARERLRVGEQLFAVLGGGQKRQREQSEGCGNLSSGSAPAGGKGRGEGGEVGIYLHDCD